MSALYAYNTVFTYHRGIAVNRVIIVLIALCASLSQIWAHPHIFIDVKVALEEDKTTITWIFDAMTSAMLIKDYDKNKDKQLDATEIALMEKDHFKPLGTYSYFMYLYDGKEEQKIQQTQTFHASIEKKRLVYTFSLPPSALKSYELRFFDPEMYVAMVLKKEALSCSKGFTCKVEGYDADFYYAYKTVITH